MKKYIRFIAAVVGVLVCQPAFAQPVPKQIPVRPNEVFTLAVSAVTIYERKNFGGRSQTLASGDNRLTDLKPQSIRVPAGQVAYLYQFVDAAGGFGIAVDLLEDRSDLSEFGLAGNVAFITVFSSTREGNFIWARGSMSNGQFIPGHWERARARGNPPNPVAVPSPPIPSRLPPPVTAIFRSGNTWTITTLGPQSQADDSRWASASPTMGVIGSDFRGVQEIGSANFERASNNTFIPDWIDFWYPNKQKNDHRSVVYFKRTLAGVITGKITKNWTGQVPDGRGGVRTISGTYDLSDVPHVANITGTFPDHDLNIDVAPFADYMYLIRDSHAPERSNVLAMKDLVDSDHDPCTDPFIKVEAEIDSGNAAKTFLADALLPRVGKPIAIYGPWIYDIGHCDHPEIHPAEQIWWTENGPGTSQLYHLNVFADASQRFWWRSQMDGDSKLHPWGAPPITGTFAIAFEVPIDPNRPSTGGGKKFEVTNVDQWNVAPQPNASEAYNLVYGGGTIVSFVPHNDAFKVSYENVGLEPGTGNVVRGFLVIETTVGLVKQVATKGVVLNGNQPQTINVPQGADPDKVDQRIEKQIFHKEEGHYVFTVTRTDIGGSVVIR